jgi:hypothetical protein
MKRLLIAAALALIATSAMAQQHTTYGPDGRIISRSVTDSAGSTVIYGPDGKVIAREANTPSGTTIYDQGGRAVGKVTREKR